MRAYFADLISETGPGKMLHTAYDTAWIARLAASGESIGHKALEWLRGHQHADGSWGAARPYYAHDRVICTLAAMTALAQCDFAGDRTRLQRAESALGKLCPSLAADPAGETIAFELLAPMLAHEARKLGLIQNGATKTLDQLIPLRAAKLASLPDRLVSRDVTVAFSAEMAGADGTDIIDIDNLQEHNGSVAHSPSATAYYAMYLRPHDPAAMSYLRQVAEDGRAPNVAPIDIFERAWVMWNLAITGCMDAQAVALCQPHLDYIEDAWQPGIGISTAVGFRPEDGDDTALVYEILTHFGRQPDLAALQSYEEKTHYRCYALESNPSISTNIHALGALRAAGLGAASPEVHKVLLYLSQVRTSDAYWYDKWHASPYYPTAHAVIAGVGQADGLMEPAVAWIIGTQHLNGAWGSYGPTAEETAYCLQALAIWHRAGHIVPGTVLRRGAAWLAEHASPPYEPLWIGKCLYCPELVIRSSIVSALTLVEHETAYSTQFSVN